MPVRGGRTWIIHYLVISNCLTIRFQIELGVFKQMDKQNLFLHILK